MGNTLSRLQMADPVYKIAILTPLLYPNNRGFTMWNISNIVISKLYDKNKMLDKFNANNSASVLFGAIMFSITSPNEYTQWLKNMEISQITEKLIHFLPFIYYLFINEYNYFNIKISLLTMLYELLWSYKTGKHIFCKDDVYYPLKYKYKWVVIWVFILYGHGFTWDNISMLARLKQLHQLMLCQ